MLPDTLAELWELAMKDLRAIEGNPNYEIDMGTWKSGCRVCMAGAVAVMENRLDLLPDLDSCPINSREGNKLFAINSLRQGDISAACRTLSIPCASRFWKDFKMSRYRIDREQFWKDAERLLEFLKEAKL
jgi:hypothetical protein